jgi:hypothetical protein
MRRAIARYLILGGLAAITLTGCAGGYVGAYARTPPPPIRVETYGPAPGPGYIWITGYWGYRSNNYYWVPGRWERPPRGHRRWEDGRWERHGDRYRWHDGRWR